MTEAPHMSLGGRLRWERERRHWTQKELAAQIEVTELSVIRWEQDQVKPRNYGLKKLEELFGPMEGWGGKLTRLWTVPYMRNLYFTGREHILKLLHTALGGREVVAVSQARAISGLGGIGKTQTAVEYAYLYGREYTLVLWVRADSRAVLVAQLAGLAAHFSLPNHAQADQQLVAKAVKHWLETQEEQVWLLIFDNVDDIALVKEFLPTKGNGAVLLTTRLQAVGTHIRKIDLDTLTLEEGIQFFQARVGIGGEPGSKVLSETERQAAEQLYTLLGGLPLALEQAAAYMEERKCSLADYVPLYEKQRAIFLTRRPNPVDPEDYPHSVATTWLVSFQQVEQANPDAVHLLHLLAFLHPDAIPEEALLQGAEEWGLLFQVAAENASHVQAAIELLQKYSLIQRHQPTRTLTIHRLVQAVIQDRLEAAQARQWAERAVHLVDAAFPLETPQAWSQCERLLPHALQVTQWIEQYQMEQVEDGQLLFRLGAYLHFRGGHNAALESLYLRAIHLLEQQLGEEHAQVAFPLNNLGMYYWYLGKAEAESLLLRALHIWEQQLGEEHAQVVEALNNLGIYYEERGKYAEAEPVYLRALAICEQQLGPRHDYTARGLYNVANLYVDQGRYAEAETHYRRALDIWEQLFGSEHSRLGFPLEGLAQLYREQGKYAQAEPLFLRALRVWGAQYGAENALNADPLTGLATIYRKQGKYAEAESLYRRALVLREQQGEMHFTVAYELTELATLSREQGRYAEAELLYQRALRIWQQPVGERHPRRAETLQGLAQLREAEGNSEEARTWYEQALALREETLGAHHPKTVETHQRLIKLLQTMGQHEQAARLEGGQAEQEPTTEA
jgi:tetratricopeptide (TPR) repeat protein/DNA-binding XRE family transcriptional regulator